MDKSQIQICLVRLNDELQLLGVKGEICLYGGAVMCLVYDARPSTKDIDAVFKPAQQMREAIKRVADAFELREDWLNDAVRASSCNTHNGFFGISPISKSLFPSRIICWP